MCETIMAGKSDREQIHHWLEETEDNESVLGIEDEDDLE